jgi:hypothetical protein
MTTVQGAYGIAVSGLAPTPFLSPEPDPAWPHVHIEQRRNGTGGPEAMLVGDDRAEAPLPEGGHVVLDRRRATATFFTPRPLADPELIHPHLARAASVFGRWAGRQAVHAGAFLLDGRAWGVIGANAAGKSTLLAALHAAGHTVVCDDVLVVERQRVYPGPRCLDLRVGAHIEGLGLEGSLVRGDRLRVELPPLSGTFPLGGWIFLSWAPALELRPVPLAATLGGLNRQRLARTVVNPAEDPRGMLDLVVHRSSWALLRPRGGPAMSAAVDLLVDVASR